MRGYIASVSSNRKYICIIILLLFFVFMVDYLNFFYLLGSMVGLLRDPINFIVAIAAGIVIPYERPKFFFLTMISITLFLHIQLHFMHLNIGLTFSIYWHVYFIFVRFFAMSFLGALALEVKNIINNKMRKTKL